MDHLHQHTKQQLNKTIGKVETKINEYQSKTNHTLALECCVDSVASLEEAVHQSGAKAPRRVHHAHCLPSHDLGKKEEAKLPKTEVFLSEK